VSVEPAREGVLDPELCGIILPEQDHFVEPLGAVRMQVEFDRELPAVED